MAHRIYVDDGKAAMMYVGQEPWHGLGKKLEHPATAEEGINAAPLNWAVRRYRRTPGATVLHTRIDDINWRNVVNFDSAELARTYVGFINHTASIQARSNGGLHGSRNRFIYR
jgi:hypothetical protein